MCANRIVKFTEVVLSHPWKRNNCDWKFGLIILGRVLVSFQCLGGIGIIAFAFLFLLFQPREHITCISEWTYSSLSVYEIMNCMTPNICFREYKGKLEYAPSSNQDPSSYSKFTFGFFGLCTNDLWHVLTKMISIYYISDNVFLNWFQIMVGELLLIGLRLLMHL